MSDFYSLKEYEETIGFVWIHITDNYLISKMKNQKKADTYKHSEVDACINNIKPFFSDKTIRHIREHIFFNYKHKNIKVDKHKPGEQISLF